MKEFKVLPTNADFRALSNEQIEFIAYSMEKDREEYERAKRGGVADADYQDYDDTWWTAKHDDFVAKRSDHDEEDIARQVRELTTAEDMAKLRARWDASLEADSIVANGGTTIEEDNINDFMDNALKRVMEEARELEAQGINKWGEMERAENQQAENLGLKELNKDTIEEAIAIFEGVDNEDFDPKTIIPDSRDDFYI